MNVFSFISASDYSLGDGALYSVVGFIVVLVVLALLVGIFYLTGFLFKTKALSKENLFERKSKKPETTEQEKPTAAKEQSDDELVAVITAAIAAVYASETCEGEDVPEFVIRRIKRSK